MFGKLTFWRKYYARETLTKTLEWFLIKFSRKLFKWAQNQARVQAASRWALLSMLGVWHALSIQRRMGWMLLQWIDNEVIFPFSLILRKFEVKFFPLSLGFQGVTRETGSKKLMPSADSVSCIRRQGRVAYHQQESDWWSRCTFASGGPLRICNLRASSRRLFLLESIFHTHTHAPTKDAASDYVDKNAPRVAQNQTDD